MIRFLADEDFNNDILRSLRRRLPHLDVVRVQDVELRGLDDDTVLAWAAREQRVLLTHDVNTLIARAIDHIKSGREISGVVAIAQFLPTGSVVQDLILIAECSADHEWQDQVVFLPLR